MDELDLKTLEHIKFTFDICSDYSAKTLAYKNLCDTIERIKSALAEKPISEPDKALGLLEVSPCLSDVEITEKAIQYAKQFTIRDKPIYNEKVQGYAVRDFFAGYKSALNKG